jgi:DNA-binding MarR family transcriptional regulator
MHPGQAVCLRMLSHHGELTQSQLAEALMLSRPSVTRLLQRMERAGLVERRVDASDQRHTWVELTVAGARVQERMDAALARYTDATLARLPENDRRDLARILARWRELADEALAADVHGHDVENSSTHRPMTCPSKGSAP